MLPVLPGGPFYLFAAFCFAKSSKSIENWFKSTSLYEKYVEAFLQKKRHDPKRENKNQFNCRFLHRDFCILCGHPIGENLIGRASPL
ncbi:DUF454 family protein [Peribacillus frigoritolerans]|nr:DUF454 family protein [Peribacillus frigoritolerans]